MTRLDRLACSRRDLDVPAALTKRGAAFRSLSAAWADTAPHGRGVLAVLAGLAEFERELIRAGRSEGRASTRANGVRMGWPHKLAPHRRWEARERRLDELPDHASFHQADVLIEGPSDLGPCRLRAPLARCRPVRAKRLFLFFADRRRHARARRLDPAAVTLGAGKR